ncbi:Potassium channel [Geranomyces variabilis]|uniref:Potassium channel n=1 Tax=Geranomyces variabilis TaxID=109894 RepID=A0AAD5TDX7_9FUNG|nr:Potassium channel [Geranomyces variabilis]
MLEKKIKWCTRLIILGAAGQGLLSLAAAVFFWASRQVESARGSLTEGSFYAAISGRQLILLFIASMAYTMAMGSFYAKLEGWESDDGIYWCISTLATIGFGDIVPKTLAGKLLLPPAASLGIAILAANIYSLRQVALELLTHRLADEYSKAFGIAKQFVGREIRHLGHAIERGVEDAERGLEHVHDAVSTHRMTHSGDESHHGRANSDYGDHHASPQNIPSARGELDERLAFSAPDSHFPHRPASVERTSTNTDVHGNTDITSNARHSAPTLDSEGVPFSRAYTTSAVEPSRTMIISRGHNLPQVRIQTGHHVRRRQVVEATRRAFRQQITMASFAVTANMCAFGAFFAHFEGWSFWEGMYFAFCSLTAIGYGDYVLRTIQSRSVFFWFLYIGIGSFTYLFSLIAERALDQWTIEVSKIANRVDRYERKAKLKKMYRKGDIWREGKRRRSTTQPGDVAAPASCEHDMPGPSEPSECYDTSDPALSDDDDLRLRARRLYGAEDAEGLAVPPMWRNSPDQSPDLLHIEEYTAPSQTEVPIFLTDDEMEASETTSLVGPSSEGRGMGISWAPTFVSSANSSPPPPQQQQASVRFRSPTPVRPRARSMNISLDAQPGPSSSSPKRSVLSSLLSKSVSPNDGRGSTNASPSIGALSSSISPRSSRSRLVGLPISRHMSLEVNPERMPIGSVIVEPPAGAFGHRRGASVTVSGQGSRRPARRRREGNVSDEEAGEGYSSGGSSEDEDVRSALR